MKILFISIIFYRVFSIIFHALKRVLRFTRNWMIYHILEEKEKKSFKFVRVMYARMYVVIDKMENRKTCARNKKEKDCLLLNDHFHLET